MHAELEDIARALDQAGLLIERRGTLPRVVSAITDDSRAVQRGTLFIAVEGSERDGHDFLDEAAAAGASAVIVRDSSRTALPALVVNDTRRAAAIAASEAYQWPAKELRIVGVTGTNGKTTTTFLLHSILGAAGRRPGLLGTIESLIGGERRPAIRTTPEAIDLQRAFREMLDAGDRSCALEATSHGSELGRLDGVRFSALAFTNLSQDHLDFHGTFERYFDAKRRLFVEGERPPAAVNVGDDYGRRLAEELRALGHEPLLTFGTAGDADIRPEQLELDGNGARLRAGGIELRTKLRGRFNVENVLAAVAVSRLLGVENDAIAAGVAALKGVPGRFEAVEAGQPFAVVVDYSHKPDALENVLRTARELARSRVICVFGCGGDRDRGKRPLMGRIASELADVAIVTSDNPRSEDPDAIIAEVVAGAEASLEVEPDRATAIGRALALAQEGDVVVIAGKGHEQGQEFAGRVVPFDDREVAREALRRLGAAL
jgi:UDP-N-acetylmuramoyl-L-alanyl-D-glutamate--2,6-diaminopimelate ligase